MHLTFTWDWMCDECLHHQKDKENLITDILLIDQWWLFYAVGSREREKVSLTLITDLFVTETCVPFDLAGYCERVNINASQNKLKHSFQTFNPEVLKAEISYKKCLSIHWPTALRFFDSELSRYGCEWNQSNMRAEVQHKACLTTQYSEIKWQKWSIQKWSR